ncbi:hypothetical protein [Dyadobacter sediminis]|uniref:hypothetical protein n=1 Tax=Dyadobacter sediminis TaxID=1493691 RepID=UPI001E43F40C|nr:hypothetical protein [Dyadobacter sediminis]
MKCTRLIILLILTTTISCFAQSISRVTSGIDLGTGYKDNALVPSVMFHQELSLNNFPWFRIGWGVRTWGYYANKTNLLPQSSQFSDDTLKFGRITSNGISFLAGASIRLWKLDIGANTDLFGLAFGARRSGLYTKSSLFEGEGAAYYNQYVSSTPSLENALPLVLDKQNGQSELFVRFWFTERIGLKAGYVHGRITYTSKVRLDNGQKRFSATYGVPFAALSFPISY